jgi:hypothetical protein
MNSVRNENDMNAEERVRWLNARDPLHKWKVDSDVYCFHCEAVFKAEDVGEDYDFLPECPLCDATPIDFSHEPWWRNDLVEQIPRKYNCRIKWRVMPIRAIRGRPRELPPRKE